MIYVNYQYIVWYCFLSLYFDQKQHNYLENVPAKSKFIKCACKILRTNQSLNLQQP